MEEDDLRILNGKSPDEVLKVLRRFNLKHVETFSFPDIGQETKSSLLGSIKQWLQHPVGTIPDNLRTAALETIRILSRERGGLDALVSETLCCLLVSQARLKPCIEEEQDTEAEPLVIAEGEAKVIVEAQKCLCNIVYNSPFALRICSGNGCIEGIVQRLKTYRDPNLSHEIKFYDMRLLFLLTALNKEIRPHLRHDLHGITYLLEVLDLSVREAEEQNRVLALTEVDLANEILKILFNLTVSIDRNNLDEEEEAHFLRLVSVLHDLLVSKVPCKDKKEELDSHVVNLLSNMPRVSYEELMTPMTDVEIASAEYKDMEYDGKNMEAIVVMLDFLNKRLDRDHDKDKSQLESLSPVLNCFAEICRANHDIRKFCRNKILPYLRTEVKRLPEEGSTLRNKLCKLLTDPVSVIHDLAADLLFVLCKGNVDRFVKYTGYGNAAGLLAQRGLMGGSKGGKEQTIYSSDSEDSDTEEYRELSSNVNPVTGRYEASKPDPMAGMTDEQKEEETMKLVNHLDKLHRQGFFQPVKIGADGRPEPVDHILQLRDNPDQPPENPSGGGDSD